MILRAARSFGVFVACRLLGCGPYELDPAVRLAQGQSRSRGDLIITRCVHCRRERWRGHLGAIEGFGPDAGGMLIDGQGVPYFR